MTRRTPLAWNKPTLIPPNKTLADAAHVARMAILVIATTTFIGVSHADVDVSDSKAQDKLDDIRSRLGDGDLNGTATNIDRTTSELLKEIRTGISKLDFVPTLTPNNQLKKITDTSAYIQQACPNQGGAAGAASGAGSGFSQNVTNITTIPTGDASSARQLICQQIIQLRVQAFNDTIDMSDRFQKYSDQLVSIDNNRQSAKTQGDLWANTNESLRTMNKLQAEMGFWRTRLAAYDAAIKFHEGQQNTLSQTAIRGSSGTVGGLPSTGQLIQTGALAAALAIK